MLPLQFVSVESLSSYVTVVFQHNTALRTSRFAYRFALVVCSIAKFLVRCYSRILISYYIRSRIAKMTSVCPLSLLAHTVNLFPVSNSICKQEFLRSLTLGISGIVSCSHISMASLYNGELVLGSFNYGLTISAESSQYGG